MNLQPLSNHSYNCETNPTCPNGDGCPANKDTCFAIPDYACLTLTDSPTLSPIEASDITFPPTFERSNTTTDAPVASPKHVFVCGDDYADAFTNCMANQKCSSGDGCAFSTTCYAIPVDSCTTPSPTDGSDGNETLAPFPSGTSSNSQTSFQPSETLTSQPVGNDTLSPSEQPSVNTTSPTPAPTLNTRFCGYNYTDALNCNVERACPSGYGCENDMTCYTTGNACLSTPAPIESSSSPTPAMTEPVSAPAHNFCGSSIFEALSKCSLDTACPIGNECSAGTACFSVNCTSLDSRTLTPAPAPNDEPVSSRPSIRGSNDNTASLSGANYWHCGFSPEDATDNCSTNKACPDGTANVCSAGQMCYPIPHVCSIPTLSPTNAVTETPTKDLSNITSFCGTTWTEAKENCYTAIPCTPGSVGECADNQGCFEGILDCKAPNITGAAFYSSYGKGSDYSDTKVKTEYEEYGRTSNPKFIRSSSCLSRQVSFAALVAAFMTGIGATI